MKHVEKSKLPVSVVALSSIIAALTIPANGAENDVYVDYSVNKGAPTYRAAGFLHGFDPKDPSAPTDNVVVPLKIKFHRERPRAAKLSYTRLHSLGITEQVVISDEWYDSGLSKGWPATAYPGDNGDWTGWTTFVTTLVNGFVNSGMQVQYDIWNEPDSDMFWGRPWSQFDEMWKRTVQLIRQLDPDALIAGPDVWNSFPGSQVFNDRLTYMRDNQVLPDIVAWHFGDNIAEDVDNARQVLKTLNIPITKFAINEFGNSADQYSGRTAAYLCQLEYAGVEMAARAIWVDWNGSIGTDPQGLGQIVFLHDGQWRPTAEWWAYKRYADITGRLVGVTNTWTSKLVAGVDSSKKESRLLLGMRNISNPNPNNPLRIHFSHIDRYPSLLEQGRIRIMVEKIPDVAGQVEVTGLPIVSDAYYTVTNGALDFSMPWDNVRDAYALRLGPADGITAARIENTKSNLQKGISSVISRGLNGDVLFAPDADEVMISDLNGHLLFHGSKAQTGGKAIAWTRTAPGICIARIHLKDGSSRNESFSPIASF